MSSSSSHLVQVWRYQTQPQTQSRISQDNKGSISVKGSFAAVTVDQAHMPPEPRTVQLMTKHVATVGKKNHFAKMCRSAPSRSDGHTPRGSPTIIHHVTSGPMQFKSSTVKINDVCIPLLLITGASVSLLNARTYHKFFHSRPLSRPTAVLHGYGDSKIDLVGSITVSVSHGTRVLPSFVFNVARRGANLMGLDLFMFIGIFTHRHGGAAIMTVTAGPHQKWASLFEGLGCLSASDYQPLIDPSMNPVVIVCWMPVSSNQLTHHHGFQIWLLSGRNQGLCVYVWTSAQ